MTMLASLYKDKARDNISTIQRTEVKESEKGFLRL